MFFFFQAEDGIRDLVRSRGLGDVYKRQVQLYLEFKKAKEIMMVAEEIKLLKEDTYRKNLNLFCLLYTSDAADERSSVDLGGRRIIKKKKNTKLGCR